MEKTEQLLPEIRWLLLQHTCNVERHGERLAQNTLQPQCTLHPLETTAPTHITDKSPAVPKPCR